MKIQSNKTELAKALETVKKAAANRSAWPILSNVLLRAKDGMLTLMCFDLDMAIQSQIECAVDEEGELTLHVESLKTLVSSLPDGEIKITTGDKSNAVIATKGCEYKLNTLPVSDFPEARMTSVSDGECVFLTIQGSVLRRLITETSYSAEKPSSTGTPNIISGVNMKLEGGTLKFMATNRQKIAISSFFAGVDASISVTCPVRACNTIASLFDGDDACEVSIANDALTVEVPGLKVYARMMQGAYPTYDKHMAVFAPTVEWTVQTGELREAIKRLLMLDPDASRVGFESTDGALRICAKGEMGSAEEWLNIESTGDYTRYMSARYVLDYLQSIAEEQTVVKFEEKLSPAMFVPAGRDDLTVFIAPMTVTPAD